MSSVVTLSDGIQVATFWEVTDEAPVTPKGLEVLSNAAGHPIVYTRGDVLNEVGLSGRVKTLAEAQLVERWLSAETELTLVGRDGSQTVGWRIRPTPSPQIKRKEGDSPDWLVQVKLWRLP